MDNIRLPKKRKVHSHKIEDRVLKYYFHLVRDKLSEDIYASTYGLQKELDKLIRECKRPHPEHPQYHKHDNELVLLYMLIGYTRDIYYGKGERDLTYIQIWVWYKHFPELAKYALDKCVYIEEDSLGQRARPTSKRMKLPYGSWKDITNMAGYVFKVTRKKTHPLIRHCVNLFVNQLIIDNETLQKQQRLQQSSSDTESSSQNQISLACKWCPRENKKHGWLFKEIAEECYNKMRPRMKSKPFQVKYKHCRQLLSNLNCAVKTVETILCANETETLMYNDMPALAMNKYHNALLEKNYDAYKKHILSSPILKSNGMSYFQIMKNVYQYCDMYSKPQFETSRDKKEYVTKIYLQKLWKSFTDTSVCMSKYKTHSIPYCIPVLDVRIFMETHNNMMLLNAIGKAIHLSEVTRKPFRHRILIISSTPEWIDLSKLTYFVDKVQHIFTKNWGYIGNMYKSFELMINSLKNTNVEKEETRNLSVVIFGCNHKYEIPLYDDECDKTNPITVYEELGILFKTNGYMTPKIVFMNENNYACYPVQYEDPNVIVMSSTNNGSFLNELSLKPSVENEEEDKRTHPVETAFGSFEKMILGTNRYICLQEKISGDLIL